MRKIQIQKSDGQFGPSVDIEQLTGLDQVQCYQRFGYYQADSMPLVLGDDGNVYKYLKPTLFGKGEFLTVEAKAPETAIEQEIGTAVNIEAVPELEIENLKEQNKFKNHKR